MRVFPCPLALYCVPMDQPHPQPVVPGTPSNQPGYPPPQPTAAASPPPWQPTPNAVPPWQPATPTAGQATPAGGPGAFGGSTEAQVLGGLGLLVTVPCLIGLVGTSVNEITIALARTGEVFQVQTVLLTLGVLCIGLVVGLMVRLSPIGSIVVGALVGVVTPLVLLSNFLAISRFTLGPMLRALATTIAIMPSVGAALGGLLIGAGLLGLRQARRSP